MRLGIKSRVLLGFGVLALLVLFACAYGVGTFRGIESKMQAVNDIHVPAVRALNQIESSFFLLESDLDKALSEGILRPNEALESVLVSRLDLLERLLREEGNRAPALAKELPALKESFKGLSGLLGKVYQNWNRRAEFEEEVSQKRSDFRLRLKTLIRDLDSEARDFSTNVQAELGRIGFLLALVLGVCCGGALLMGGWMARSMTPLEALALQMREISEKGLNEEAVQRLALLPVRADEVGTLTAESFKMAASILDNQKLLQDQKLNIERAHLELGRQNVELRNTQNKLVHSEKLGLVGRMAAQMAHEIRNPLNALSLHAEILEEQLKNDKNAREGLHPLRTEINKLISVTESYLDLARGPRIQKTPVVLNEIVEELKNLYQPLLKEKGIYFTCDLGDIPSVPADRPQLAQVVGNLIKNASEAFSASQRAGNRYIRMMTAYNPSQREVTVTVMDNGAGIPLELQKNIFSPFYTNKAEGTGLGLTFSRQVVEAHGGEISFDSAPNQGTKFTIRLPVSEVIFESSHSVRKDDSAWMHTAQQS